MNLYVHIRTNRCLGRGGEGVVYLAENVVDGTRLAVKFPNALLPDVARLMLHRDIVRMFRIRGDYVARPIAWNLQRSRPFVVYEYARFGSLRSEMDAIFASGKTYHPRFALRRAMQILKGVHDTHMSGYVHRDVKPDNVLVYSDEHLKLADFGCATRIGDLKYSNPDGVVGTLRYAAPEQRIGLDVDQRADVFSVGITLYEMLMGATPDRLPYLMMPTDYLSNATRSLDQFVARLLSARPALRPRSAAAAYQEASAVLREYNLLRSWDLHQGRYSFY